MKKKLFTAALAALAYASTLCAPAAAAVFEPGRISFETGKITHESGNNDLAAFIIQPELLYGNVTAVVDINILVDRKYKLKDSGNDIFVLNSLSLNKDKLKARYGDVEGLTLGRGFIVNNYYSGIMNNTQSNEQKGLVIDMKSEQSRVTAFGTLSHIAGARAERKLGRATVGATLVMDSDPDLEIYGLDAKFKITPDRFSAYIEAADIVHGGNGFTIGSAMTFEPNIDLTFTGEYRKFDSDFAPGIVDDHYEARPAPSAAAAGPGKVDGFYWSANYRRDERFSFKAFFEDYEAMRPRAGIGMNLRASKRAAFDIYYAQQNFVPSGVGAKEDSVILGRLNIGLTSRLDLLVDYYRAFDDARAPLESVSTKIKYHKKKW